MRRWWRDNDPRVCVNRAIIGIGRHHRTRVLILAQDHHITVINAATGEVLRDFTLDSTGDYQPRGVEPGNSLTNKPQMQMMSRDTCQRCLGTSHGRSG